MYQDDPLSNRFFLAKLSSEVVCQTAGRGAWALDLPARPILVLHHVTEGSCVLRAGRQTVSLYQGDVALVRPNVGHRLDHGDARAKPVLLDRWLEVSREEDGERVLGRGATTARALCGVFRFEHDALAPLLQALPTVIHAGARAIEARPSFADALARLRSELHETRLARRRWLELVLVELVRLLADREPAKLAALGATQDPVVARAIAELVHDPARAWDVDTLARTVGVSRATLARRFLEATGAPPMAYRATLRTEHARRLLRETTLSNQQIAHAVGFATVQAFQRAFRRATGATPSAVRAQLRAAHG
ncbi:AraC family transcriptional regulator [Sorangium sp. So ce302]|uniref:AraC family transcriptional regulator n=1 Tax=Sorangium sp. So ce302 TaxID=3133297 RepID=UPI003F5F1BAF